MEDDMFSRSRISLVLALLLSLIFTIPVFAGGWAVITLDELPSNVVAGEPVTIGFTVLQHGITPMTGLNPTITANLYKDAEFVVPAEAEGKPGYYTATLTFPKEGDWRWSIQAFAMDQPMPMLSVAPATAALKTPATAETTATSFLASPMVLGSLVVLVLGLAGAVVGFRRRSRPVMALTVLCLLVGILLLVAGAGTTLRVEAQSKSEPDARTDSTLSQVELGRQLFLAKGCITCHYNRKVNAKEYWTIEMGAPNLSNFSASPEALFMRLKDPASVKSDTRMPNLDLTKPEIEALIAFINSK